MRRVHRLLATALRSTGRLVRGLAGEGDPANVAVKKIQGTSKNRHERAYGSTAATGAYSWGQITGYPGAGRFEKWGELFF